MPTETVAKKVCPVCISLFADALVVVPAAASLPPDPKTGELVSAFQEPINLKPPANPFICDCSFPIPSTIESVAKTLAAAGVGNPVNTLPVTELLSNVIAPLSFDVPSILDIIPVASPVTDKSLDVSQAVAVSALPVKAPVTFPVMFPVTSPTTAPV